MINKPASGKFDAQYVSEGDTDVIKFYTALNKACKNCL
jgi:hypothetical protein